MKDYLVSAGGPWMIVYYTEVEQPDMEWKCDNCDDVHLSKMSPRATKRLVFAIMN